MRRRGGRKADGALRMERRFLETDDCLDMVTRETPQTTDGEGMKSRGADSPGEVCQASEASADLILLESRRLDQPSASTGSQLQAHPAHFLKSALQLSSSLCLLTPP